MCGFVGYVGVNEGKPSRDALSSSIREISHRGPDGAEEYHSDGVVCGHVRLSIIDLSDAASQPMVDDSGRYVLIFNGEIYNYKTLVRRFFPDEDRLSGAGDSAVLLAMFCKFGTDCLKYLDGMFAFAIIDTQTHSVFLARDRFGEKPLYWRQTRGGIAFASELRGLKALLPHDDWVISPDSILKYHCLGSVPAPATIYRNVYSLQPASFANVALGAEVVTQTYWRLDAKRSSQSNAADQEHLSELLIKAVRSRSVSDVPIGVFLSGGLDSGSILSACAELDGSMPTALSLDFPETYYSEFGLASETAHRFDVELHRALLSKDEFAHRLDDFFAISDQPTVDGFNTFFVSLYAKERGIKVWLSGVGGDELFGGYPSFNKMRWYPKLASIGGCLGLDRLAYPALRHKPYSFKTHRVLSMFRSRNPTILAYQTMRNTVPPIAASSFLADTILHSSSGALGDVIDNIYPSLEGCSDYFQAASLLESNVYMGSQLLRDIDNFSMAHSIEVRSPFLDHELFEFVYQLPASFKTEAGKSKPLLAKSLPNTLPNNVLGAPKRGFTFPVEIWLKERLQSSFEDCVLDESNAIFWKLDRVRYLWQLYLEGKLHWSIPWQFYAFSRWVNANT